MGLQPPSFLGKVNIELKKTFVLDTLSTTFFLEQILNLLVQNL